MRFAAAIVLSALCVVTASPASADDGFHWQSPEVDCIDLTYGGRPALRYVMPTLDESSAEKRNDTFKPYHHVWSPDGATLLTKGPGGLFPHHRGLFFGFNKITYGDGKQCDTWHCTGKTFQSHEKELSREERAESAKHAVAIDWHGQEGEIFAREIRTVAISRQTHHGVDGWIVDFASHLATADGRPVHLDGDPQHAGFQFRASQEVPDKTAKQTYFLRPDGKGLPGETRNWDHERPSAPENIPNENLPWKGMSIVVDGKRFTIVYLDHPSNPKPSRYSERDYGRFGSYFVADVTDGKPLDIRYRLWIQEGEMTVEQCETLSKAHNAEASHKLSKVAG